MLLTAIFFYAKKFKNISMLKKSLSDDKIVLRICDHLKIDENRMDDDRIKLLDSKFRAI